MRARTSAVQVRRMPPLRGYTVQLGSHLYIVHSYACLFLTKPCCSSVCQRWTAISMHGYDHRLHRSISCLDNVAGRREHCSHAWRSRKHGRQGQHSRRHDPRGRPSLRQCDHLRSCLSREAEQCDDEHCLSIGGGVRRMHTSREIRWKLANGNCGHLDDCDWAQSSAESTVVES